MFSIADAARMQRQAQFDSSMHDFMNNGSHHLQQQRMAPSMPFASKQERYTLHQQSPTLYAQRMQHVQHQLHTGMQIPPMHVAAATYSSEAADTKCTHIRSRVRMRQIKVIVLGAVIFGAVIALVRAAEAGVGIITCSFTKSKRVADMTAALLTGSVLFALISVLVFRLDWSPVPLHLDSTDSHHNNALLMHE